MDDVVVAERRFCPRIAVNYSCTYGKESDLIHEANACWEAGLLIFCDHGPLTTLWFMTETKFVLDVPHCGQWSRNMPPSAHRRFAKTGNSDSRLALSV